MQAHNRITGCSFVAVAISSPLRQTLQKSRLKLAITDCLKEIATHSNPKPKPKQDMLLYFLSSCSIFGRFQCIRSFILSLQHECPNSFILPIVPRNSSRTAERKDFLLSSLVTRTSKQLLFLSSVLSFIALLRPLRACLCVWAYGLYTCIANRSKLSRLIFATRSNIF